MKIKSKILHEYKFPAEDEPDDAVMAPHHIYIGIILMWFGFQYTWPYYPHAGAVLTLLGLIIAADDVVSHTFGVWTPFDWGWKQIMSVFPSIRD